jgi:predicted transcriptional regulator
MRALSIHQPYAELILRGIKRIEYRSRPTRIIGERFYIYAVKGRPAAAGGELDAERARVARVARGIWSDELAVPGPGSGEPPAWMMELAERLILGKLPCGVIVGTAVIERCEEAAAQDSSLSIQHSSVGTHHSALGTRRYYRWHLSEVERIERPRRPARHPQPVWFMPW